MLTAVILAAALTAMPLDDFFRLDDYPNWALREDRSAAVEMVVVLDSKGRVEKVETLRVVGDGKLAREIATIVARARSRPAIFADGGPAYFKSHDLTRVYIPGSKQGDVVSRERSEPDFALAVKGFPAGMASAQVKLLLAVNADGTIADCLPSPKETAKSTATSLCAASGQFPQVTLNAMDGKPVRYVTEVKVQLQAENSVAPK